MRKPERPLRPAPAHCDRLLARRDLAADRVFLLVQGALFPLGDVATVLRGHGAFLLTDLPVLFPDLRRLSLRHRAGLHVRVHALVLVCEPAVDLGATGMVFLYQRGCRTGLHGRVRSMGAQGGLRIRLLIVLVLTRSSANRPWIDNPWRGYDFRF